MDGRKAYQMTDLPAGPELDHLIAEKVMGWTRDYSAFSGQMQKINRLFNLPDFFWWKTGPDDLQFRTVSNWSPSTNIAHAWEVVKKMGSLCLYAPGEKPDDREEVTIGWRAVFKIDPSGEESGWSWEEAETAPLAICRAALALVEWRRVNASWLARRQAT